MCRLSGSSVEEARDLIARGINVDEQNDYQCTALHYAVDKGRIDIVRELIRAGAALDVKDWVGRTARRESVAMPMSSPSWRRLRRPRIREM